MYEGIWDLELGYIGYMLIDDGYMILAEQHKVTDLVFGVSEGNMGADGGI